MIFCLGHFLLPSHGDLLGGAMWVSSADHVVEARGQAAARAPGPEAAEAGVHQQACSCGVVVSATSAVRRAFQADGLWSRAVHSVSV